jgi:hypothetical protein
MMERAPPTVHGKQLRLSRIHRPNEEFDVALVGIDKHGVSALDIPKKGLTCKSSSPIVAGRSS